jgi:hypothetical protein
MVAGSPKLILILAKINSIPLKMVPKEPAAAELVGDL